MTLVTALIPSTPAQWVGVAVLLILSPVLYYITLWIIDPLSLRRYPGPLLAQITPYWLFWQARHVRRFVKVHEAHKVCPLFPGANSKKYGKFVRIAPDHISINDPDAIHV